FYTFRRSKAIRRKELPPRLAAIQRVQSLRKVEHIIQNGETVQHRQSDQKHVRCDLNLQNNKFRYTKCLRRLKMKEVRLKQVIRYDNFRPARRKPVVDQNKKIGGKAEENPSKPRKSIVEFGWVAKLRYPRKSSHGSVASD
ncbi:unnamed protein product, partial [Callosobruchus maculatus]